MTGISVFVDSKGGNTRMVAVAIAEELGVKLNDVGISPLDDAKILFLGSGTYGGRPGEGMIKFIEAGNFTGRNVALFGTSMTAAGAQKMIAGMEDTLTRKGATVLGSYQCKGKFLLVNRGRPNTEDLDNAKKFAREMLRVG